MHLTINNQQYEVPEDWRDETLLNLLRENIGLTGTKFGCGRGLCGACTVHVNGQPMRACLIPVTDVQNTSITTIEGLASNAELHPIQQAWLDFSVPQCGYCQAGQIMTAVAFLATNPAPFDEEIRRAMDGNLCRCGTYPRIHQAVKAAAHIQGAKK